MSATTHTASFQAAAAAAVEEDLSENLIGEEEKWLKKTKATHESFIGKARRLCFRHSQFVRSP